MNQVPIEFDIGTTDAAAELGIAIWLDETCVYQSHHVTETYHLRHDIDDDEEVTRRLKIVMTGKMSDHTQLDSDGNIVKDSMLNINNIMIDGIDINNIIHDIATYQHDFNSTQPLQVDRFFGNMGCNGSVEFEFSTPCYLWLLEHM